MENILEELKKKFEDYGEILVYGAGEMGNKIFYLLGKTSINIIKAFVVNKLKNNLSMIENISVEDYRNYINSDEKIVIALFNDEEAVKVRLELVKKGINTDRIIMLKSLEKSAIMKKIQIPFQSGKYWEKRYVQKKL